MQWRRTLVCSYFLAMQVTMGCTKCVPCICLACLAMHASIAMHCNASWQYQGRSACVCMRGDDAHTSVHACYAYVGKCTPKSSRTSWIFHCLVEIPYPQPNIEIRKPSIELKFFFFFIFSYVFSDKVIIFYKQQCSGRQKEAGYIAASRFPSHFNPNRHHYI